MRHLHHHPEAVTRRAAAAGRLSAAGGYPPQQAGYPPPGGYPPAGPGYPGAQAFNVGEAFSWAWNKFSKNAAALIVPTLVYGVIISVIQLIFGVVSAPVDSPDATSYTSEGSSFSFAYNMSSPASFAVTVLGWIVALSWPRRSSPRITAAYLTSPMAST